jgi:hypothetical protein
MAYDLIQNTTQPNPNYIINSTFQVAQAATSATITAGTATPTASLGYPVFDSWFAYSVGGNPTLAQIAGTTTTANRLQLTGAASITSVGIGQRIEAINTIPLALKVVTLSFECSNSLLTSLTVTANRPTTTANTFGTIGTPIKTLINSSVVTINSALTRYSVTFICPQEVDKGLEILFTLGAQTSGTFVLSNVKLEEGAVPTPFTVNSFAEELRKCQRYYYSLPPTRGGFPCPSTGGFAAVTNYYFKTTMFGLPVISPTYSSFFNVASFGTPQVTLDDFSVQVVGTTFTNTFWTISATCSAYIP